MQRRELADLNHVGALCFVHKRLQRPEHENGIGIDDWYEASGLRRRSVFLTKNAFLVLIGILGFRIRRPGRRGPICVFLIMRSM